MKFVHVADIAYPHVGGVEYVVMKYSQMQKMDGHTPIVITAKLPGTPEMEMVNGVKYIRLSKAKLSSSIISLIKRENPDLVHTHSYLGAIALSFLWRVNKKKPILRHIHDVYIGKLEEYSGWGVSNFYGKFEKRLIKLKYRGYIVPSNYTKKSLAEIGVDEEKINVVHPGVNIDKFGKSDGSYARKKHGLEKGKKIIGFVGRLSTGKGPQFLIEAAKNIDAYVILVGPNPNPKTSGIVGIREKLEKMVREYNMGKRVIFAGKVSDYELPLYYDSFDVFCLPSLSEGFGMSIAEALAAGKPVVSFNTAAIPEIVKDNYNGFLVEPKDVESLREKISILLTDESTYRRIASNTRKSVEKYTWENSYHHLMEVYSRYL